jgi:hypothetical protein
MSTPSSKLNFVASIAACVLFALPAFAGSQARIVRLSDVHGSVQIDKNSGLGFENAFLNLPITQGTQLRTRDNGRAEIEFEDGSSLRLAPNTMVEFNRLGLNDSGVRVSQVHLVNGMAYVDWLGNDDFTLSFSRETVSLDHAAHFRVNDSADKPNLAVFKGLVVVDSPAGDINIAKNKTATFDSANDDKAAIASKVSPSPFDAWDTDATSYHDQYTKNNSAPVAFGASDMNYYGSYSNVPGYGMLWQPYFTGVGWDPFMDGAWGFYPGYGYMFASAYPWGWMPYHYGNWLFVPTAGWMWQPGGYNNFLTVPSYTPTTLAHVTPLTAPTNVVAKTVFVGRGEQMLTSTASLPERMTLKAGSAGLQIPRGSLDNLKGLNHEVAKRGSAIVEPAPAFSTTSPRIAAFGRPLSAEPLTGPTPVHTSTGTHASASGGSAHH